MRKITWLAGVAAVAVAGTFTAGSTSATPPDTYEGAYVEHDGHKVTICHRTGSASNPYVVITVDIAAVDGSADDDHSHHEQVGNGAGGDVIPPIPGVDSGDGDGLGKNWDGNWLPGASKKTIEDSCAGGSAPG